MRRFGLLSSVGLIVLMLISVQTVTVIAANPIPTWAKTYHATGAVDSAKLVQQTADGGFIVAGRTNSSRGAGKPPPLARKTDPPRKVVLPKTQPGTAPHPAKSLPHTTP